MDKNTGRAILVADVVKRIGKRVILHGVTLEVSFGEVHVLAGPNGAGKTTTLRVILGLARRDSGRVLTLGVDPLNGEFEAVKSEIGYLPEDARPYERLTGWENLYFYALAYARGDRQRARVIAERGAKISGLSRDDLGRRASSYSRGMSRRLLLARALMHGPRLAILDEPTAGLDVFSALKVRETVRRIAAEGSAVLVTTHNLLEAQEMADRVTFIAGGRSVCTCTVDDALERYSASNLEEAFVKAVGGG